MAKDILITFRATENERDYLRSEAKRLSKLLGFSVSVSDLVRLALFSNNKKKREGEEKSIDSLFQRKSSEEIALEYKNHKK